VGYLDPYDGIENVHFINPEVCEGDYRLVGPNLPSVREALSAADTIVVSKGRISHHKERWLDYMGHGIGGVALGLESRQENMMVGGRMVSVICMSDGGIPNFVEKPGIFALTARHQIEESETLLNPVMRATTIVTLQHARFGLAIRSKEALARVKQKLKVGDELYICAEHTKATERYLAAHNIAAKIEKVDDGSAEVRLGMDHEGRWDAAGVIASTRNTLRANKIRIFRPLGPVEIQALYKATT